ncbi:hypothetical protein GK047_01480 [Paenibacillus sp. SYP-B3998]|uniref:Bacterial EndoU nuclease domain-containing protein n=1 Tax=Paenibacillus sp. SYP-B3998 TaxID=2678564 RepID=A0A6G3ZRL0_9BACL|nr:RHS repeat-associated core domain-containing protein [Paenibacillus sp. SYP-B3998]NEW04690.1 hypothetical protein [Paenibacillus sp. SYP-B3998]
MRYYWDGSQVIAEANVIGGVATLKARYIRGQGLVAREDGQGKVYYLQNGHGDVVNLMDSTGKTKLNSYSYDIWGSIVSQQENLPQPFKYSGEIQDDKVGLQYLRARWYDPGIGRFVGEDSYKGQIDNPLSLNLYTYVENNPLTRWDPSGHSLLDPGKVLSLWNNTKDWVTDKYEQYKAWKEKRDADFYEGNISYEELKDIALSFAFPLGASKGAIKAGVSVANIERTTNFSSGAMEHIFTGVAGRKRSSGWHYAGKDSLNGNTILDIQEPADTYGTIVAQVQIGSNKKYSSFFSSEYSSQEVVDMINQAFSNRSAYSITNTDGSITTAYRGTAGNGMTIDMFLNGDGLIDTAFPVHQSYLGGAPYK